MKLAPLCPTHLKLLKKTSHCLQRVTAHLRPDLYLQLLRAATAGPSQPPPMHEERPVAAATSNVTLEMIMAKLDSLTTE
ncbi:hypothetical protein ACLOJK_028559, partial [Asimina triloba]